ncbi:LPS export ABC transporter periplasmic protein LptC [Azospirillum sp. TSO22-1]|uniref:LPS export ABC transporter periplasmic protein LptC n=1 Tax=Azospirillum sp. TSO22-1 TaxID=716789 RepID=UPI001FFF8565|nr:LPS export ABC transporter periplasmic protein LptC [Azospirillum sp. TSO22-1]
MQADDLIREDRKTTATAPRERVAVVSDVHRRRVTRPVSRSYSRIVTAMKLTLPAVALAAVALIAAWPTLNEIPKPRLTADKGQLEMINPRYFSADEKNQPFSLTAVRAEQSTDQPGIVVLDKPVAEMTETAGTWVTMRSERGWYDQNTGILKMRGSVRVMRDDGSEFTTEEAYSEIRKGTAWGDVHVESQGPQGVVLAEGFRMSERGRTMVFLNSSNASVQSAETAGRKK